MIWKTLILLTGSESPVRTAVLLLQIPRDGFQLKKVQVVVVLSGSMEPAFYRGDILFLHLGSAPLRTGKAREELYYTLHNPIA